MGSEVYRWIGVLIILYLIVSLAVHYTIGSLIGIESYVMDIILLIFALYFVFIPKTKINSLSKWALFLVVILFIIDLIWFMSGIFSWMIWLWPFQRVVYPVIFWIKYWLVIISFILLITELFKSNH